MQNNKPQPKQETKLRIQSSVYPDGWGQGIENFNAVWQHIFNEADKIGRDPRQVKSFITQHN